MAGVTLSSVADRFPVGTSVKAYPQSNWQQGRLPPSGSPQGSEAATAVVAADSSLTFTGLTENVSYFAYAQVGGVDRYVAFRVRASSQGAELVADVDIASALPTGTNAIGRIGHDTTGFGDGRKTVAAAGTAEAIASSTACKWVIVSALTANTQQVNVGASTVLAAVGTSRGTPLMPGDSVSLPIDNLNKVYVDSRVNGEGVSYSYGT